MMQCLPMAALATDDRGYLPPRATTDMAAVQAAVYRVTARPPVPGGVRRDL
jgi:hypothetical protein